MIGYVCSFFKCIVLYVDEETDRYFKKNNEDIIRKNKVKN